MGAFALASVGADAAAVVVPLWVPPASTLVVVGIGTRAPCRIKKHAASSSLSRPKDTYRLQLVCKRVGTRLLGPQ
jgi:hypothetical protein